MDPKNRPEQALDDDAITEILLRLPAKSVCRFRCVSKLWLSHTSSPRFIRAHAAAATAGPSAFYLYSPYPGQAELISVDGFGGGCDDHTIHTLSFLDYKGVPPEPVDCCNGLLLCRPPGNFLWNTVSVCNPTTKEHEVVPLPDAIRDQYFNYKSLHLAFDPRRSPHYTIFAIFAAVSSFPPVRPLTYKYTSQNRSWKLIEDGRLSAWPCRPSVYWHGSFVWSDGYNELAALDVEAEQNRAITPPPPGKTMEFLHLASSGERLHYIRGDSRVRFEILEMTSEPSGWLLLHMIDLGSVEPLRGIYRHKLLGFIRGDDDDQLLLRMPTEIVSYHPRQQILATVSQVERPLADFTIFPLAHTLFPLNVTRIDAWPSREWVSWKSEHDQLLISLLEHSLNGKKMTDGFHIDAWNEMVRLFNEATHLNYDGVHLQNRLLSYQPDDQTLTNILANYGFRRAHGEKVDGSDIDWLKIFRQHNKALGYKRKRVPSEDMGIICASSVHLDNNVSQNTCLRK